MNLSFLTSDFFSVTFACVLFQARLHVLYFFAFTVIILALVGYNLADYGFTIANVTEMLRTCRVVPASGHDNISDPYDISYSSSPTSETIAPS
jgi:hypothetical protein